MFLSYSIKIIVSFECFISLIHWRLYFHICIFIHLFQYFSPPSFSHNKTNINQFISINQSINYINQSISINQSINFSNANFVSIVKWIFLQYPSRYSLFHNVFHTWNIALSTIVHSNTTSLFVCMKWMPIIDSIWIPNALQISPQTNLFLLTISMGSNIWMYE